MRVFKMVFFLMLGLAFSHLANAEVKLNSGLFMPTPKPISDFSLEQKDPNGKKPLTFNHQNLQNKWTLMFFGFTNCPSLCPTSMAELATAYQKLTEEKFSPLPQVVFVSVDPERDTLEKVNLFASTFNKNFLGLRTNDMNILTRLTHETNSMFQKVPGNTTADKNPQAHYTIDHTGDIIVFNPEGKMVAMLTMPHKADDIVKDYETIVKNEGSASPDLATKIKSFFS